MEILQPLLVPLLVLLLLLGNHVLKEGARATPEVSAIPSAKPAELSREILLRIVGEVVAAIIWLIGSVMTLMVIGFRQPRDTAGILAGLVAFYGFIPVAVAAAVFALVDRRIRRISWTVSYVLAAWLLVLGYAVAPVVFRD